MAFTKVLPTGISSATNLVVDSINSAGVVTATGIVASTGTFSGNVSIAGTLTYEDVTNIDSVGLITARQGIHIGPSAGVAATLTADGGAVFTGVLTATSFSGDGSSLTGIDATQIVTGNTSVQTVDTGSDGHVKVTTEGTERLRVNSSGTVQVGNSTERTKLGGNYSSRLQVEGTDFDTARISIISNSTNNSLAPQLVLGKTSTADINSIGAVENTEAFGAINFMGSDGTFFREGAFIEGRVDGTVSSGVVPGSLRFHTTNSSGSRSERLRVTSTGAIGIGSDFTAIETTGGGGITLDSGVGGGQIGVFLKSTGYTGNQTKLWQDSANAVSYLESTERPLIIKAGDGSGDYLRMDVGGSERARILSTGDLKLNHGLTGLTGGGVLVCASSSSSSSSGSWPETVDFVIPMGNLSTNYDSAVKNYYSSGETGATYGSNAGSACLLLASCWNTYYWGYATKLYLCTVYGQSSKVTALQQLHAYNAAGHPSSGASISLSVVSTTSATPKLRATFSGDYWNSNHCEVVMFGGGFANPTCLGPTALTGFNSNLTGQDAAWT